MGIAIDGACSACVCALPRLRPRLVLMNLAVESSKWIATNWWWSMASSPSRRRHAQGEVRRAGQGEPIARLVDEKAAFVRSRNSRYRAADEAPRWPRQGDPAAQVRRRRSAAGHALRRTSSVRLRTALREVSRYVEGKGDVRCDASWRKEISSRSSTLSRMRQPGPLRSSRRSGISRRPRFDTESVGDYFVKTGGGWANSACRTATSRIPPGNVVRSTFRTGYLAHARWSRTPRSRS